MVRETALTGNESDAFVTCNSNMKLTTKIYKPVQVRQVDGK